MPDFFKKYPLFIFLFPSFILIHIEKEYHSLIVYSFVIKEILILYIAPLIVYGICLLLMRSFTKANILSFLILLLFYFGGEFKDWLRVAYPASNFNRYVFLIPLSFALLLASGYFIKRSTHKFEPLNLYFNIALLLFIAVDVAQILLPKKAADSQSPAGTEFAENCTDCDKPDIYYIIFDSYASSSLLQREFDFDNAELQTYLTKNDFKIIKKSKSNYNLTPFSIASIFNMDYLADADSSKDYFLKNYLPAVKKVYYNHLFPFFQKQGYEIVNQSIFNVQHYPSTIPLFDIWEINTLYQQHNFIRKMYNEIGWQFPSWLHISFGKNSPYFIKRDRHDRETLSALLRIVDKPSVKPRFVYSHVFIPHGPYSYDSSGNKIKVNPNLSPEEDKQAYISQLKYSNTLMMQIVDTIKKKSKKPPVIIIQGDHGYRFFNSAKAQLEFENLNAFYFPSRKYDLLNDSLTTVNTFRIVLNTFFSQRYPLLENKNFFLKYR